MKLLTREIKCVDHYLKTKRTAPFRVAEIQLNCGSEITDRNLVKLLTKKSEALVKRINRGAANDSLFLRSQERVSRNLFAGLLSEVAWKFAINHLTLSETLRSTEFVGSENQIDLISDTGLTIEVRSSFPRKGINFALCHPNYEFNVVGPYSNSYKPGEIQKDIYVMTLFPFEESDLVQRMSGGVLSIYLTGGATKQMFQNPEFFITKSLTPAERAMKETFGRASSYRAIPFSRALDTFEIAKLLGDVHSKFW